jgi:hypothetical protein
MTLQEFIKNNRAELDLAIHRALGQEYGYRAELDDKERRLWILHDEQLYNWARSEGVAV